MVIRKGKTKKRTVKKGKATTKRPNARKMRKTKVSTRRGKPQVKGNVDVKFVKDKTGNHYVANIPIDNKNLRVDLIGYTSEDITKLKIDNQGGGIISISKTEKDGDTDELVMLITDVFDDRQSKSLSKKRCGHFCSNTGADCCIDFQGGIGKGQCLQCNERERIKLTYIPYQLIRRSNARVWRYERYFDSEKEAEEYWEQREKERMKRVAFGNKMQRKLDKIRTDPDFNKLPQKFRTKIENQTGEFSGVKNHTWKPKQINDLDEAWKKVKSKNL